MSGEQRLNSLDRFRKQPGRLVLEEHGHCEVPAGCGGVVLRWRNPFAALPLTVHLYSPAEVTWLVDGNKPPTARVDLAPGTHVFGFVIANADLSGGLLMCAAVYDPKRNQATPPAAVRESPLKVLTAADGTWKA